jgi:hypothetical protein
MRTLKGKGTVGELENEICALLVGENIIEHDRT